MPGTQARRWGRPVTKLAAFALVLVASFGAGAAVGAALPDLGPSSDPPAAPMAPAPGGSHQP
jgi:hypothetical protein